MKTAIQWFSRNHVAGNFLMLAILLAGFAAWFQMRKEIFPELEVDAVLVTIPYPNATPVEAERGVNVPVEEAIADLLAETGGTITDGPGAGGLFRVSFADQQALDQALAVLAENPALVEFVAAE